jgi:hypothetical protein
VVHGHVRLHVGVFQHSMDVLSIHFYDKISDANGVNVEHTKGVEELDLGLGIATLVLVPRNQSKAGGSSLAIFTPLATGSRSG